MSSTVPAHLAEALRHLPKPDAILFDWDNTLIDSWPVIHASLNATLSNWNLPLWSLDEVKQRVRYSMRDSFPAIFGEAWQQAGDFYLQQYRSRHLEVLHALELAEDVLQELQKHGIFVGIVSNKTGDTLRKEVAHLGWQPYFQAMVGAGDALADKPSAAPVHMALKDSGLSPDRHRIWLVGDAPTDVECARNSGCLPVFFGTQFEHDNGTFVLNDGEHHSPDHTVLLHMIQDALKEHA